MTLDVHILCSWSNTAGQALCRSRLEDSAGSGGKDSARKRSLWGGTEESTSQGVSAQAGLGDPSFSSDEDSSYANQDNAQQGAL